MVVVVEKEFVLCGTESTALAACWVVGDSGRARRRGEEKGTLRVVVVVLEESRGRAKRGVIKRSTIPTSSKSVLVGFFVELSKTLAMVILEERNHTPQLSTGDQYP